MKIIIGLGNPGRKYINTRHNAGFLAIDKIISKYNISPLVFFKKFNALVSMGFLGKKKVIIAKPQVFMNNSGVPVKALLSFYKILSENLYVFHDDIDIALGKFKFTNSSSSAGHKGIESIIKELKTKNFNRFRLGISPTEKPKNAEQFVLKRFSRKEKSEIEKAIILSIEEMEEKMNYPALKGRGILSETSSFGGFHPPK